MKLRLAAILAIDELDLRFYEFMSSERRAHVMALLADKVREAAKLVKKKPGQPKPDVESEIKLLEIPPLPDDKKLWELGLENDAVVFFVYRTHPSQWGARRAACTQRDTALTEFDSPSIAPRISSSSQCSLRSCCVLLLLSSVYRHGLGRMGMRGCRRVAARHRQDARFLLWPNSRR